MESSVFSSIRNFLEEKSILLWRQENRGFAKIGLDESKFHRIEINNREFYIVSTNVFYQVLNSVLSEACEKYPESFGTDNVEDVLKALYKTESFGPFDQFSQFLREEQFAWIVEIINDKPSPLLLRIELFRKINDLKENNSKSEFTGGVFHSFKHFNLNGVPLSTKKENKNLDHPSSIIDFVIQGFFFSELQPKDKNKFQSKLLLQNGSKLCFAFFHESNSNVYFLNSVIPN